MYNNYMGAVDKNGQVSSYFTVGIQTKKWPPRIFSFLLERSIVYAFICELESKNHNPLTQLEFCVDLIHKLVENYNRRKGQERPRISPLNQDLLRGTSHNMFSMTKKDGPRSKSGNVCKAAGRVKRRSFMCLDCNV